MSKQSNTKLSNSSFAPVAVGFFLGALTVGTALLFWNHDTGTVHYTVMPTPTPNAPAVSPIPDLAASPSAALTPTAQTDPAAMRVAAQFVCSCGTCGKERLDVCTCETAQAERAFIQEQLRNGHTEDEAAKALNQKYGGLKTGSS